MNDFKTEIMKLWLKSLFVKLFHIYTFAFIKISIEVSYTGRKKKLLKTTSMYSYASMNTCI